MEWKKRIEMRAVKADKRVIKQAKANAKWQIDRVYQRRCDEGPSEKRN